MNKLTKFRMFVFVAMMLIPFMVQAQTKNHRKGISNEFSSVLAMNAQTAQRANNAAYNGMRRLNSNTTMYGIFQKVGNTFLGKGRITNPMTLDVILSRNDEPAISEIDGCALVGRTVYTVYMDPITFDYTHMATLRQFDAFTGEQIGSSASISPLYVTEACATDPLTGEVWGRFAGNVAGDRWEIACVDFRSLERRAVGLARRSYICMGMTTSRELYAVGHDGNLYRISTTDGSETLIGATGLDPKEFLDEGGSLYHMNGAVNPEDNMLYMTYATNKLECSLMSIDITTGKASKVADFAETTLGLVVFFPENSAENEAPAQVTDFKSNFVNSQLTGNVTFKMPTRTYGGQTLSGQLGYEVRADGQTVESGTAQAGQTITTKNFTLSTQGYHGVEIVAKNSAGRGAQFFHSFYAGIDTPKAPDNVKATVNPDNGKVTITWSVPGGKNEGFVGNLTYNVVRYPDNVTVATGLSTTTFTETLDGNRDIQPYTYGVSASNGTFTGAEGMSNKCVYGAALDIPYQADFSDFDFFTLNDVTGDGKSFYVEYIASSGVYMCRQNHAATWADPYQMDDWLILPKINLQKGKTYKFNIPQFSNDGDMNMTIAYGKSVDVSTMNGTILPTKSYPRNTEYQTIDQEFTVSETGAYHIGIHSVITSSALRGLNLRNTFTITEVTGDGVPATVTQLSGQGGANGAKTVKLQFTAPTKNVKGANLSGNLKANVYYRNRIIKTVDITAGQQVSVDYASENIPDGYATFTVTAENADGNGEPVSTQVYVGYDTPVMAGEVKVADKLTSQFITWDAVTTVGQNNYYVNTNDVEYVIYDVTYNDETGQAFYEELGRVNGATSFEFSDLTTEGEQHETYKGVRAVNRKGSSNIIVSSPLIKGTPYGLPFEETLANGSIGNRLIWVDESRTTTSIDISQESYDTNSGSFIWTSGANSERASLNTGKISLRGASNKPVVSFAYYATVGQNSTISLVVQTPDGTEKAVTSVNMRTLSGDNGWRVVSADLSEYKSLDYVIIKFVMNTTRRGDSVLIDAINVYDMLQYNLGLTLSAPTVLKAGMQGKVVVTINNTGENTISSYTVRLSADDKEFYRQTINEPLASQESKEITVSYKPSVNMDEGLVYIMGEVETDIDLNDNDNWMEAEVEIREATAAVPINVFLVQKQLVAWESPGETTEEVTETCNDLNAYDNGNISINDIVGNIGEWLVYDGDGQEVYNFNVNYPGRSSMALSWMVWDTSISAEEARPAPVGTKYFASFNPLFGAADDWLISPLLADGAQSISFRANVLGSSDDAQAGIIEVLYTTEEYDADNLGDFINSFRSATRITLNSFDWTSVQANLPEGTRHFAIRNVSNNGFGVAVSQIDYEKGREAPISFNVYGNEDFIANVLDSPMLCYPVYKNLTYAVSAVYANGEESKLVEAIDTDDLPTAIEGVVTDSNERFDVYTLDGKMLYKGVTLTTQIPNGIYVVNGRKVSIYNK